VADSVTINETGGAYYTWDGVGATATWDSATASTHRWDRSRNANITADINVDPVAVADADPALTFGKNENVLLDVSESPGMDVGCKSYESFNLRDSDNWINSPPVTWADAGDQDWRTADILLSATFIRELAEALGIVDSPPAFGVDTALMEDIGIAESNQFDVAQAFAEAVAFVEQRGMAYSKEEAEAIALAESDSKDAGKEESEAFSLVDADPIKDIGANPMEAIEFAEALGRTAIFIYAITEGIGVQESVMKAVSLPRAEQFAIGDEIRRNAQAVISDVLIKSNSDITLEDFNALLAQAQPVGYGPFVHFMEGEQRYQSAIFKAILTSTDAARPRVTNLAVTVDVPDVRDSGPASVVAGGTVVNFNRRFYAAPEVTASLKGGTVFAIPRVTSITTVDFRVELFDRDGISIAGTVTWAATGY
jgi:hypothetical protein